MVATAMAAPGRGGVRGGGRRGAREAAGDHSAGAAARCGASHGQRRPPRLNRGLFFFHSPPLAFSLALRLSLSLSSPHYYFFGMSLPFPLVCTRVGGRACFRPQPKKLSLSLRERRPPASAQLLFGATGDHQPVCVRLHVDSTHLSRSKCYQPVCVCVP